MDVRFEKLWMMDLGGAEGVEARNGRDEEERTLGEKALFVNLGSYGRTYSKIQ